ncbi:sulfotransferase domain-containing protein [Plantactinospora sp. KLBMP9567]|uniref:sulfotransferase domain-containing protein n=1 Tax=Plantactinospora sp. KLBMP9567 TaxID=3085900 RepID=UPI002980D35A|nr:sulfotransferase domain-containing protein [Plantactinospora sp. KLBMP9567]MDW5326222.1 sulfotransferase domain-containing protein [Plantactinospora sp. KLBMP9567]
MPQPTALYQNVLMDSTRWHDFPFRDGDIVISTPPKCGTTWMQMICALLVFQSTDFPRPLDAVSLWPDLLTRRHEENLAVLAAQSHRRFLKTHIPLDGLPYLDQVEYVCVGRDPRDAAISWDNHIENTDFAVLMGRRVAAVGAEGLAGPGPDGEPERPAGLPERLDSAHDRFWAWIDNYDVLVGLAAMVHHLDTFWRARHLPNVTLLHYDEMKADLDGTMRRLAARFGVEVAEERWPDLVRAARFDQMRGRSRELTPDLAIWYDPTRFFHRGETGQWRELLDADGERRYRDKVQGLGVDPDLVRWIHQGGPLD